MFTAETMKPLEDIQHLVASLYVKSTVDIRVGVLAYTAESVRSGQFSSGAAAFRAKGWLCLRQSHFRFVCINRVCMDEVEPQVDIVLYLIFCFLPLCAVSSSIQDFKHASVIQVVECQSSAAAPKKPAENARGRSSRGGKSGRASQKQVLRRGFLARL